MKLALNFNHLQNPKPQSDGNDGEAWKRPGNNGSSKLVVWFPPLIYLVLASLFLWRSTFTSNVFLPAGMLSHFAPWRSAAGGIPEAASIWNPLRWDGIIYFYPSRFFLGQQLHSGTVPLWNPYQLCGAPFLANIQSAVFYPPNWLFAVIPAARAFGVLALLHLTLCGWFFFLLMKRLGCRDIPAILSGVIYSYSAWQVSWLQLPTFLAASCWFSLLFHELHRMSEYRHRANEPRGLPPLVGISLSLAMILLAGHLQIAFYGIFAAILWSVRLLVIIWRENGRKNAVRFVISAAGAGVVGSMLAMPQLLPAIELSKSSHRQSKPSEDGYRAYMEYGLPAGNLITAALPNFYGSDAAPENPYWGFYQKSFPDGNTISIRHNFAETALFLGIIPLLLGAVALVRFPFNRKDILFFCGLAILTLCMAMDTPLDRLFYFGIPGFGQSGSPARCLVLWSMSWAALAGFGLDTLLNNPLSKREYVTIITVVVLFIAVGLSLASSRLGHPSPGRQIPVLGEVISRIGSGWVIFGISLLLGVLLMIPAITKKCQVNSLYHAAFVILVIAELFISGIEYNPTARPDQVFPDSTGIATLRSQLKHERIFPVNQLWSLNKFPPAVFPPNASMVYGFRDVQGYDSLLTAQYKAFATLFARPNRQGVIDASPPEVGNMVFFQNSNSPKVEETGAAFAITSSADLDPAAAPNGFSIYDVVGDIAITPLSGKKGRTLIYSLSGSASSTGELAIPEWVEDGTDKVSLRTNTPNPVILRLADTYMPGWIAKMDGLNVPIHRDKTSGIFREVNIPGGTHLVSFQYEPANYRLGLYLACLGCLMIVFNCWVSASLRGSNPSTKEVSNA